MNLQSLVPWGLLLTLLLWALPHATATPAASRGYVAFSMREAQSALATAGPDRDAIESFAGITHLAGLIHDPEHQDLVVVGYRRPGFPAIRFEDWVVALRSIHRHEHAPVVSLDPTADTSRTGKLLATFAGGIERTRLAQDMLACDVLLKKLALGHVKADVWGVPSYVDLRAAESERTGKDDQVSSRFWFRSRRPTVAVRDGVYALLDVQVGIDTEVMAARVDGQQLPDTTAFADAVGNAFCSLVEASLEELGMDHPVLLKARQFIALVSFAEGLREIPGRDLLAYALDQYPVRAVDFDPGHDCLEVRRTISGGDRVLTVRGGLDLTPYVARLKRGHTSAFKEVVLKSRPSPDALTWSPPLHGWEIPGAGAIEEHGATSPTAEPSGFTLDAVSSSRQTPSFRMLLPGESGFARTPFRAAAAPPRILHSEFTRPDASGIGGVALTVSARSTLPGAVPSFESGGFALVTDGAESRLDPKELGRFTTALWAVYTSATDPGISIDPIAAGVREHLVRYIGNVINSDLGRVMRVADYTMKSWAVGTERPNVPGFQNPDDIAGRKGVAYVGRGSRFWFVPEDMSFRQADGLLVFNSGHMTVKTEYLFGGGQGPAADPANTDWARWFTDHYEILATTTPVLKELFDYAKLVALTKYLKESGTPLLWFLLANKDLVLTEDSPGTVTELVKDSEHFEGLRISGGVQIVAPANYVPDESALAALRQAHEGLPAAVATNGRPTRIQTLSPDRPIDVAGRTVSFVPQHRLSCGQDRHGNRYQTDVALRRGKEPGLELVRWRPASDPRPGEFGMGWHLLIPYRIQPVGDPDTNFMNARVPSRMSLRNLISGREETLFFDAGLPLQRSAGTNSVRVAGWAPKRLDQSEVLALFLLTDGSYSLKDKLNNVFQFDPAGYLVGMRLGQADPIRFDYAIDDAEAIEPNPFHILPGREQVACANALVPRALTLVDRLSDTRHTYLFDAKSETAGYSAAKAGQGLGFIAWINDGSLRLESTGGNRLDFEPSGKLVGVRLNGKQRVCRSMTHGDQRVEFRYLLHPSGRAFISRARAFVGEGTQPELEISYRYDEAGRLIEARPAPPKPIAQAPASSGKS